MGTVYVDWPDTWTVLASGDGSRDIDALDLDDENTITSAAISQDAKVSTEISVAWTEGNDGACDGDVYVYVLRDIDGTNYQTLSDPPALGCVIDATQNTTRYGVFTVHSEEVSNFKILVDNDSGRDGNLTVRYKQSIMTTS